MKKLVNLLNINCNGNLTEETLKTYLDALDLKIVSSNDVATATAPKSLSTLYIAAKEALRSAWRDYSSGYVDDIYNDVINNKKNHVIDDVQHLTNMSSIPSEVHEFCAAALDSIN